MDMTQTAARQIVVEVTRVTRLNRGARRCPLRDITEYRVYENGVVKINVTSRAEVKQLVRRRWGANAEILFWEVTQ